MINSLKIESPVIIYFTLMWCQNPYDFFFSVVEHKRGY